jgi:hypothetical protein
MSLSMRLQTAKHATSVRNAKQKHTQAASVAGMLVCCMFSHVSHVFRVQFNKEKQTGPSVIPCFRAP